MSRIIIGLNKQFYVRLPGYGGIVGYEIRLLSATSTLVCQIFYNLSVRYELSTVGCVFKLRSRG